MFVQLFALMITATIFCGLQNRVNQLHLTENYLEKSYEYSQRKIDAFYRWINQV